uniref:Tau95_N domain-containing protein n=1 Tax=Steinernema glaseri TaxID=37863 RepID=A0A1I7YE55_9BILA
MESSAGPTPIEIDESLPGPLGCKYDDSLNELQIQLVVPGIKEKTIMHAANTDVYIKSDSDTPITELRVGCYSGVANRSSCFKDITHPRADRIQTEQEGEPAREDHPGQATVPSEAFPREDSPCRLQAEEGQVRAEGEEGAERVLGERARHARSLSASEAFEVYHALRVLFRHFQRSPYAVSPATHYGLADVRALPSPNVFITRGIFRKVKLPLEPPDLRHQLLTAKHTIRNVTYLAPYRPYCSAFDL